MHVHFLGEADDGTTVSSQHATALRSLGFTTTFESKASEDNNPGADADLIHLVTGEQTDFALLRRLLAARKSGLPIIRWWTSQDALWAMHHAPTKRFAQLLARLDAVQLADSSAVCEALSRIGITARKMPLVNPQLYSTVEPVALPTTFTVLSYLPSARREFHGGRVVDTLIHEMPDVRFLILGGSETDYSAHTHVESLGYVDDIARTIRRATVVVQLRLDGEPSRLVFEALCHGRLVVSSASVPCCHFASHVDDCLKVLRKLRSSAEFNLEGREYVCREHDCPSALVAFKKVMEEAINPGRVSLAVSGTVKAAKLLAMNPGILNRKPFPPLDTASLPKGALAMKALIGPTELQAAHHG